MFSSKSKLSLLIFSVSLNFGSLALAQISCEDILDPKKPLVQVQSHWELFEFVADNTDFKFFSYTKGGLSGFKDGRWHELGSATVANGSIRPSDTSVLPSLLEPKFFTWSDSDALAFFRSAELRPLEAHHQQGLQMYAQGRLDRPVNLILRGSSKIGALTDSEIMSAQRLIPILEDAFSVAPSLPLGLTVYRGISNREIYGELKKGDVFTDKGYGSSTLTDKVARRFANLALRKEGRDFGLIEIMVIKVNSEFVQGYYMPYSAGAMFGSSEQEVLILSLIHI